MTINLRTWEEAIPYTRAGRALDEAVNEARKIAGELSYHKALWSVVCYLRACQKRGVDPLELQAFAQAVDTLPAKEEE